MAEEREYTLEENFERLNQMIRTLEGEELSLEEAFRTYSEGMNLLKQCNEQIDKVEKQVLELTADGCLEVFDGGKQ